MKLYGLPPSPNTWKVRAFAHHIGVPIELELVDLTKGAHRTPAYMALNPTARTPTLVDGDFVLWESSAILSYLADLKAGPHQPNTPRERADILRWHSWQTAHFDRACQPIQFERLVKKMLGLGAPDADIIAKAEAAFHLETATLNAHLATREQLVGDAFTTADFIVGANLLMAEPAGMPLEGYEHVRRWRAALMGLPAWAATAPKR